MERGERGGNEEILGRKKEEILELPQVCLKINFRGTEKKCQL